MNYKWVFLFQCDSTDLIDYCKSYIQHIFSYSDTAKNIKQKLAILIEQKEQKTLCRPKPPLPRLHIKDKFRVSDIQEPWKHPTNNQIHSKWIYEFGIWL